MNRNTAGQFVDLLVINTTTNQPKSGATFTGAYVKIDGGAITALTDVTAEELGAISAKGVYRFSLTQAETNGYSLLFSGTVSDSGCVVIPRTIYTALDDQIAGDIADLAAQVSAAVSGGIVVGQLEPMSLVGFPTELNVGDSYTTDCNTALTLYIRDDLGDPVASVGSHFFTDADFAPTLVITQSKQHARVEAELTYIDPGGGGEPFLRVEIPSSQTRRATAGAATMQCVLKWTGAERTLALQPVTWIPRL
jgi:hypothetical protein